jgi:meso-butanediol dehydrogenase/(S,S)-butanediol dehydrogenase/diacetyl reductase
MEVKSMSRFDGKAALITGAASGIGREVCLRLAAEGASVYCMDINAEGLAETEGLIKDAGGTATIGQHDVTQRSECFDAVARACETFGKLDVLGNIAGIVRFANAIDISEKEWRLVHAVNLDGPFFMCQAAIPKLLETGGNIINMASNAGLMGQAYTSSYCSSKGALVNLTRSLAMELVKQNIRINGIAPSGTVTNLVHGVKFPENVDVELMKPYLGFRPMSDASEIAGAFAYLASDEAKSVHGTIFSIDNGVMAG